MSVRETSIDAALGDARRALECWQTYAALGFAKRALEQARCLGRRESAQQAEILLARATLSVSAEPNLLSAPASAVQSERLTATLWRFECEKALASGGFPEQRASSLSPLHEDALAVWVLERVTRPVGEWSAWPPSWGEFAADEFGWSDLVRAISAEATGAASAPLLERAFQRAREHEARSVLAAGLLCRAAIAASRRAFHQERAHRLELVYLLESWALELNPNDARSAMKRPDRVKASGSELLPVTGDARLVRVALNMAEESNLERLAEIALAAALEESEAERGVLVLRDGPGRYRAAKCSVAADQKEALVGFSRTIAHRVLDTGEPVATNDVTNDARFSQIKSLHFGVTSVLCVPAKSRALVEGAIYLDREGKGRPFDEAVAAAVTAIGSMLAAAMAMRRTLGELENKAEALAAAQSQLAQLLTARTDEVERLQREAAARRGASPKLNAQLVGKSAAMDQLREAIARFAVSDAPVFIAGETGTGKELVAQSLHHHSRRAAAPFIAVNCGALSENLLEAELFGAERGAFTGATTAREGLFEAADGGTLLLDEVGDMPAPMQVALLRTLETGEVRRVGSTKPRRVNVRILSASHKDLAALVQVGQFRADLRYRLEVVRVQVPRLCDRREDIVELADHLLIDAAVRYGAPVRKLSPAALDQLRRRNYPGNVRELRHVLTSAALMARGMSIEPRDLPADQSQPPASEPGLQGDDLHETRAENIRAALRSAGGHRGRAAEILGISRATFYRHLELYRIEPDDYGTRARR
jgi:DNA-binding NtrC family response regulator